MLLKRKSFLYFLYYITIDSTEIQVIQISIDADNTLTSEGSWTDEAYRTVTFESEPTGDLLTWLTNNAVKQ